jgi:hypothetical protein
MAPPLQLARYRNPERLWSKIYLLRTSRKSTRDFADGFVEIVAPRSGSNVVPFLPAPGVLDPYPALSPFCWMWFANRDVANYIHVIAADGDETDANAALSSIDPTEKWTYIVVGEMEDHYGAGSTRFSVGRQDVEVHEIGHVFNVDDCVPEGVACHPQLRSSI